MIEFHLPALGAPELSLSPLHRAAMLTLRHLVETGPIGLTRQKALKRYFVTWAAEEFNWPGFTATDLFALNKVLNEDDFPPLVVLHDLLLAGKLARHRKGCLHITQMGRDLLALPGSLWLVLAQHLLLSASDNDYLEVEWVSVLNAVNIAAHTGMTETEFCRHLLGGEPEDAHFKSAIYAHVLQPLCWLGLLLEARQEGTERLFTKSALWPVALTFEELTPPPVTRH